MPDIEAAIRRFGDARWRLSNLYYITDKDGKKVRFEPNWAQAELLNGMHHCNVVLKARQLGFTTFIQLFMLDQVVFNSNTRCGTIAHTLVDAQSIFADKVRFPYDHLPEGIRERVPVVKDSATELKLANNSSVRVGTSLRGGTLQVLHISEYGKICAKYPDKAREIRTGALNTLQAGQLIFIESTAEGQDGHFYEVTQQAETKTRTGERLTPLDFKFHFFPWHRSPDYSIDPSGVVIPAEFERYFIHLEASHGISLTAGQRAWYVKKAELQKEDMKREFPSTSKEAFEASIEGAYYGDLIAQAELKGRIGPFAPATPDIPVSTAWDIGHHDYTSIWFFQPLPDRFRFLGFIQGAGEGMPYWLDRVEDLGRQKGWDVRGGEHCLPHDGGVVEWGTGRTREEQMRAKGWRVSIVPRLSLYDGINAVRAILPLSEFDQAGT